VVFKFAPMRYFSNCSILIFLSVIIHACSPFSGPVDEAVSDSYYFSKSGNDICYSPMGNWFELGNDQLNADAESFEVIAPDFGRDKDHLYFKSYIIDSEADKNSFTVKEDYIFFDKNHVYVPFDYLPYEFRDEHQHTDHLWIVEEANPETFEKIDSDWSKDDVNYYYNYQPIDVDYHSFEVLNENFAKDQNQVYLLKDFQLLTSTIDAPTAKKLTNRYILDKNYLYDFQEYQNGKVVDSLIAISIQNQGDLRIIENEYLLFDKKIVYDGFEIENVDASTFQVVKLPYTKDQQQVYYYGKLIKGADPVTFEVFESPIYTRDKDRVFAYGEVLQEADVKTFGPSDDKNSLLYRDKNHIYRGNEIVTD